MMNMYFALLYFKRKSYVLHWKVYNISTLYIVIFYLRAQFDIFEFNKERWQMYESIIFSVIVTLTGSLVTFVISKINQFWKIAVTIIMIGYIGFVSARACLQDPCCAQIADVKFSVRNITISKV